MPEPPVPEGRWTFRRPSARPSLLRVWEEAGRSLLPSGLDGSEEGTPDETTGCEWYMGCAEGEQRLADRHRGPAAAAAAPSAAEFSW